MEGNQIELITKFATPKKRNLDEVFRKKITIDLDEKSNAMDLFGLKDK